MTLEPRTPATYRISPAQEWILTIERLRFLRSLQLTKVIRLADGTGYGEASRAVSRLFRGETALRTLISRHSGAFSQHVELPSDSPLPHDRIGTESGAAAALAELLAAERARPVNPRRMPARARLFSAGPDMRLLILTAHHAVADWWALEVAARRAAELIRTGSPTEPKGMSFAAYADGLASGYSSPAEYWTPVLAGARQPVLPADYEVAHGGTTTSTVIWESLVPAEELRKTAARAHATPFAVLLAAFAVVLRSRAGQDDILIATQLANRGRTELAELVGCLTTTVPVRLDASGDRSFGRLTADAQRALAMAYRHGQINFGHVMNACGLGVNAQSSVSPSLLFQMIPPSPAGSPALAPELQAAARPGAGLPVDLHIGLSISGQNVRCEAEFNDRVFRRSTIAGLAGEFARTLRIACTSMSSPVEAIGGAAITLSGARAGENEGVGAHG
jgi:condensation domain-containing protein